MPKLFKEDFRNLSLMLSIPINSTIYIILNHPEQKIHSLVTSIDSAIPFLKVFILPYISWQLFIYLTLTYLEIKDKDTYFISLIAINLSLFLSYLVFYFYQTTVPRPVLTDHDLLTKLVQYIYNQDAPYNCFPSIHVLTSNLMIKAVNQSRYVPKSVKITVKMMAFLIILSTQFIKQHVILDAIFGILLSEIVFRFVVSIIKERAAAWTKKPYLS